MRPTLHFTTDDTRESALRKAGVWYDYIADHNVAKFATAIGQADVSCEEMLAAIEQGRLMAAEGRSPYLAWVAEVLDHVIAMRRSQ